MAERKCELLGKRANRQAMTVSFSHRRNKKVQGVNLQEKKVWWEEVSQPASQLAEAGRKGLI